LRASWRGSLALARQAKKLIEQKRKAVFL